MKQGVRHSERSEESLKLRWTLCAGCFAALNMTQFFIASISGIRGRFF
jgi:hypothetical protein